MSRVKVLAVLIAVVFALALVAMLSEEDVESPVMDIPIKSFNKIPEPLTVVVENFSIVRQKYSFRCSLVLGLFNPNDCDVSIDGVTVFVTDENGDVLTMNEIKVRDKILANSEKTLSLNFTIPAYDKKYIVFEGFIRAKADGREIPAMFRKIAELDS
jgi:hypothetical protein